MWRGQLIWRPVYYSCERPPLHVNLGRALSGCLPHTSRQVLEQGFQDRKGSVIEGALRGEEGGAVKLECQG
jgi:hypothetical protein